MSRKGTSAIYKSTYYLEIVMRACHRAEASQSFNIPSYSRSTLFEGTPIWPPQSLARDRGFRVARNTFLWVLSTHKNFTKDWRTLRKSLRTIWESCQWLGLHPSYSLLFYEIVYKYEAKPPPNIIFFSPLHHSQTENITEHNTFQFAPLKQYID